MIPKDPRKAASELARSGKHHTCVKCGINKKVTALHFKPDRYRRGHDATCRACRNDYVREWRRSLVRARAVPPWPKGRLNQIRRALLDFLATQGVDVDICNEVYFYLQGLK